LQQGYEVSYVFSDNHSAKTFRRPAFESFLTKLKDKEINVDYLIVTKIDRLSRNTFELPGMTLYLKQLGVTVFSLNEGELDFTDTSTFFPLVIQSGAAQYENMLRGENTIRGMRQALKEGRWVW